MPLKMRDFQPGVAVPLTLTSLEPKDTPSQFGPEMVFQSTDGPVYLSVFAANQVAKELDELAIRPGDPINIVRRGNSFKVMRGGPPAPPVAGSPVWSAPNGNGGGNHAGNGPGAPAGSGTPGTGIPATTQKLMACFMSALEAVAEAQAFASRKGLGITFTSDNVTSAALSCYINECKGGR
jgi:hypothetical protein